MEALDLARHAEGTVLAVRAQPGAKRAGVVGTHAGALRVAVTAAPERGKANAAVVAVLADVLGCRATQLVLLTGPTSREKRFLVTGIDPDALRARLAPLVAANT